MRLLRHASAPFLLLSAALGYCVSYLFVLCLSGSPFAAHEEGLASASDPYASACISIGVLLSLFAFYSCR